MIKPEAFAITCVTCGSRLKVSSRTLIGTIESCPKCGAMVQIAAPDDEAFGLDSTESSEHVAIGPLGTVDSEAITQSAVADVGPGKNVGNKTTPSHPSSGQNVIPPPPVFKTDDVAPASHTQVDEATDYRREIEGAWQSESTQRTKQLVLIALLALFGLIAVVVVFSQFVRSWRDQQVVTGTPHVNPADITNDPADDVPSAISPTTTELSTEPGGNEALATTPESMPNETAPVPPLATGTEIPPLMTTPLELPSTQVPSEIKTVDKENVDDSAPPQMKNLPPGLLQYVPLLSLETTENQTAKPLQAPPTIDAVRIDEAANDEAVEDGDMPHRKPIDVVKALALPRAIDNKPVSLAELALVISQLTTVPIEIELISLDAAGIQIETPIKSPNKLIPVRDWIDGVCKSSGMVSQTSNDRVMLSASDERVDSGVSAALKLDDFGDDAQAVFKWISPLLLEQPPAVDPADPADPAVDIEVPLSVRISDDGQSIVPGVTLQSKVRAMLAIEAVRLMRGMAPKLERWRTNRWMGPWPANNVTPDASSFGDWPVVSEGKCGPQLDSPRAAADLIRTLAKLNQAEVLVGWYDAARHSLFPADSVMPYTDKPTAAAMLDEIIGEQGLQARVCGPALWYICSEASYDRFEVITWFSIPPGSENEIRQRLANSLNIENGPTMPIAFDDNRMLVRCPRYLARQMQRIITP